MDLKIRGVASVDAERVAAKAADFAVQKNVCGFYGESRKMHRAFRVGVAIALRIRPARSPARTQKDDGAGGGPAMAFFPGFDDSPRKLIVRVFLRFPTDIEHDRGTKEFLRRDLFYGQFARRKMSRCVEMRAVMFEHPETARKVAVFFNAAIRFCFKNFWIAGPGNKLVIDGIAQIDDFRFAGGDSFECTLRQGRRNKHGEASG